MTRHLCCDCLGTNPVQSFVDMALYREVKVPQTSCFVFSAKEYSPHSMRLRPVLQRSSICARRHQARVQVLEYNCHLLWQPNCERISEEIWLRLRARPNTETRRSLPSLLDIQL